MLFRSAADLVMGAHLAFILFALLGALLVAKWRWLMLVHLPAAAWAAFVEFTGRICPLTDWENDLLARAGQAGYTDGFIAHYLSRIIYPGDLTQAVQFALAGLLIAVNAGIYAWLFLRKRRGGQGKRSG
jgi:hypothetical protein